MCTIGNLNIGNLFNYGTCIITESIIPLLFALAAVLFVWGVVKFFIINADEEAKRTEGKQFMIWGIIALSVLISVWGLVRILGDTFDLNTTLLPGVTPSGTSVNPARRCGNGILETGEQCDPPNGRSCDAACQSM